MDQDPLVLDQQEKAFESLENLEKIEGFDTDLASEILSRSKNYLKELEEKHE